LNIVLTASKVSDGDDGKDASVNGSDEPAVAPAIDEDKATEPGTEPELETEQELETAEEIVVVKNESTLITNPQQKLLSDGKEWVSSFSASLTKSVQNSIKNTKSAAANAQTPDAKKFAREGKKFMDSIGSSITKSSSSITKGARQYVSQKTMVTRAEKSVGEIIPVLAQEIGVEMSIRKRFQQGPVFVLEVDLKGCDLGSILEKTLGQESGKNFKQATESLKALGMETTLKSMEKEILPEIRKGLMEKMSLIVPNKIREQHADLEIMCIALEDAEEAKWLYNFLEFMESMKQ